MTRKERFELYSRQADILERVATQYPEGSAEYKAIRQAAIALFYGLTQAGDVFVTYLDKWDHGELSEEQIAHLKSMGIEPDYDPNEPSDP